MQIILLKLFLHNLSPSLIRELIEIQKRGVSVELITTDKIEDFTNKVDKNILKLIIQNRTTDKLAIKKRLKLKKTLNIFRFILFAFLIVLVLLICYFKDSIFALGFVFLMIPYIIYRVYKSLVKMMRCQNR